MISKDDVKFLFVDILQKSDETSRVPEEYLVKQGEARHSGPTLGKLGTHGLCECVAVILQDKKTKQLALVHHYRYPNKELMSGVLSELPKGEKEMILVGAFCRGTSSVYSVLLSLLDYPYPIYINKSYILDYKAMKLDDDRFSHSSVFCDNINTNFGTVIVDPETLEITNNALVFKK